MSKYRSSDLTRQFYKLQGKIQLWFCQQTLFICWVTVFNYSQLWVILCQPCELYEHSKLNYHYKFSMYFYLFPLLNLLHWKAEKKGALALSDWRDTSSFSRQKWKALMQWSSWHPIPKASQMTQASYKMLASNQPVERYSALPKLNSTALRERHREALWYMMCQEQCSSTNPGDPPTLRGTCPAGHGYETTTAEPTRHVCADRSAPTSIGRIFAEGISI